MVKRKAGLACCSNGIHPDKAQRIEALQNLLLQIGIETVRSECMFSDTPWGHGDGKARADALMQFYNDPSVTEIYDVSGGDLANEILPYLDYPLIATAAKPFWGYSDLTVILNAVYAKTGREGVLYQVRNLLASDLAREEFDGECLFDIPVSFLRGSAMEGIVLGGNIRCFLKLAGTEYFPDLTGKILLLEANGGEATQMITYLNQLRQLGAFEKVSGILLGTFTKMEMTGARPTMEELVLQMVPGELPVAKTYFVGHGIDSRAVRIGGFYRFDQVKYRERI